MDYSKEIWAVISYIEKRIKTEIQYEELERITGFSYRHLRAVFRETTGVSLSRYINSRKSANAAFMLAYSGKSATEIAYEFGFESYDTFTRVFKRETGIAPSEFKRKGGSVGRRRMGIGMYAPVISLSEGAQTPALLWADRNGISELEKGQDSCVLYGVPKVHYGLEGWQCSPFPMCLKVVLNYLGQDVEYPYLMVATGMAFRLRWNPNKWDPGNVGIQTIYEDPEEGFRRAFQAVGRECYILPRQGRTAEEKELFKTLIRQYLDKGRPLIAIGIIGPPEAGIITGYRKSGDTLLGWSLFQENMEFAAGVSFDESGYYITDSWWDTVECVIAVGELQGECMEPMTFLDNGLQILKVEEVAALRGERLYYGGQAAYRAWADAIENDSEFPRDMVVPLLLERLMCQSDAEVMVSEGRYCVAGFLRWLTGKYPELAAECERAAVCFDEICKCINEMMAIRGGCEQSEDTLMKLADRDIRKQIAGLIRRTAVCEEAARKALEELTTRNNS